MIHETTCEPSSFLSQHDGDVEIDGFLPNSFWANSG